MNLIDNNSSGVIVTDNRGMLSFNPIKNDNSITFFKIINISRTRPVVDEEWAYSVNNIINTSRLTKNGHKIYVAEVFLTKRIEYTKFIPQTGVFELWSGGKLIKTAVANTRDRFIKWDESSYKLARAIKIIERTYENPFNANNNVAVNVEEYVNWDSTEIPDEQRSKRAALLKSIKVAKEEEIENCRTFFAARKQERSNRPQRFIAETAPMTFVIRDDNGETYEEHSTHYKFNLPEGLIFSPTAQSKGENIPIYNNDNLIGYAVTAYYAIGSELYDLFDNIPDIDTFNQYINNANPIPPRVFEHAAKLVQNNNSDGN